MHIKAYRQEELVANMVLDAGLLDGRTKYPRSPLSGGNVEEKFGSQIAHQTNFHFIC